jgi:16S rRNA (adenine1518-N6/adenine1519-N6)-dimethyltransferase
LTSVPSPRRLFNTRKALGQHYLRDRRYLGPVLRAAQLLSNDTVIEVGPGRGVLTSELINRVRRVVAVELDPALVQGLRNRFESASNLEVVEGDARLVHPQTLLGGLEPYKVVANLPYYAASRIVRSFLESAHSPQLLVIMVQKEVAKQMVAPPGKMTLLSVGIQVFGEPRIVTSIPPKAFSPPPKVMSSIVSIKVYEQPAIQVDDITRFFSFVRGGFSAPRKQLRNSLSHGLGSTPVQWENLLHRANIQPTRRAETLSIAEWGILYGEWQLQQC